MTDVGSARSVDNLDPDLDFLVNELYRWRAETRNQDPAVAQQLLRTFLLQTNRGSERRPQRSASSRSMR